MVQFILNRIDTRSGLFTAALFSISIKLGSITCRKNLALRIPWKISTTLNMSTIFGVKRIGIPHTQLHRKYPGTIEKLYFVRFSAYYLLWEGSRDQTKITIVKFHPNIPPVDFEFAL